MRRVLYLFLPRWPIDRLRRDGLLPGRNTGARSVELPRKAAASDGKREGTPQAYPPEPPFATVTAEGGRQVLAAANPKAEALGLRSGMPLADALSFLPGLLTRPAEPAEDAAALRRLAEWCGRYSPWTAPDGDNGIKIEITGAAHLWGGEAALAADLSRRLRRAQGSGGGVAHRLAIADTLGAAWALARFAAMEGAATGSPASCRFAAEAGHLIAASGEAQAALAPLPVAALRLDPLTVEGLHRVGLRRIGEVMAMPRDALARRFGDTVARRLDQALDDLPEPLSPLGETPSRRVRLSFAEPIADPADLARAAERLTLDLASRLAREGMGARRLDLGFHRVDGRVEHIRIGTARASRDPAHLAKLLIGRLDAVDPGFGIEDVILAAFAVEKLPAEQIAMAGGAAAADGTAPLLDRLGARLGLARLEPRASHIPERASVAVSASAGPHPDPSPPAGEGTRRDGGGRAGAVPQKPPRPIRLFAAPEPVEALWILPDDPPFRFTWRRRAHRIAQADGPERIAEEWWRAGGPSGEGEGNAPWPAGAIRDYYRVEDETGRRFWLFRAGLPGDPPPRWFIHGVFA